MNARLQGFPARGTTDTLLDPPAGDPCLTAIRSALRPGPSLRSPSPAAPEATTAAHALLRGLEARDAATARHSVAVARYVQALGTRLALSEAELALAHVAAMLHDLGKLSFPDHILAGDAPLDDEDWLLVRRHPAAGARLLEGVEGLREAAPIVLAHHERLDGRGYPRGVGAEEIPPLARLVAVADCFDAMTARDSYRAPLSAADAALELERVSGTQLDSEVVRPFVELLSRAPGAAAVAREPAYTTPRRATREPRFGVRGRTADEAAPDRLREEIGHLGAEPAPPVVSG